MSKTGFSLYRVRYKSYFEIKINMITRAVSRIFLFLQEEGVTKAIF